MRYMLRHNFQPLSKLSSSLFCRSISIDFRRPAAALRRWSHSPQRRLIKLAGEYIFAQLCEVIILSIAAENKARMRAMIAARTNVHITLDQLIGDFRRLRQEEITSEIVELASGSLVLNDMRRKRRPKS